MKNLRRKLSYTLYLVLVAFSFNSCITPIQDEFNELQPPIIIIGISEAGGVTVCDVNNKYLVISGDYILANTLNYNYCANDTIGCFYCR